ncbi:MAG: isoprenyl transferase [Alphaproteobacteria bacterium]|nr:isoprenyl transferase [Alphaproteobacteria bacterium]
MSKTAPLTITGEIPNHIAIIMDGNGRWARQRGLPRAAGHRKGADAVRRTLKAAGDLGVSYLTLFGFSAENWQRPISEIEELMGLLRRYLRSEIAELYRNNVRLRVVGERDTLPGDVVAMIDSAEEQTRENDGLNFTVALSYGGRQDLLAAVKALAHKVADGSLRVDDIGENDIARHLATAGLPDPDLLIRTSGEQRLSNFMLWQMAYTEFVFSPILWPDFDREQLEDAIREFDRRERRFGARVG